MTKSVWLVILPFYLNNWVFIWYSNNGKERISISLSLEILADYFTRSDPRQLYWLHPKVFPIIDPYPVHRLSNLTYDPFNTFKCRDMVLRFPFVHYRIKYKFFTSVSGRLKTQSRYRFTLLIIDYSKDLRYVYLQFQY